MSLLQAYESSLHNCPGDSAFSAFPDLAYNKLLLFSGRYGAFDAHVLAKYNDHWITSPNINYIPQPFIFEGARWPQLHAEHYIWSTCIPRKSVYCDNPMWKWMWWNVSQLVEDFVLERGSAFKVGRIHTDKWKLLEAVYNLLDGHVQEWMLKYPRYDGPLKVDAWLWLCRRCLLHLKQLPFTFQDTVILVAFCQCLCLDIFGMLEYLETVLPPATSAIIEGFDHWMGAFTMDPKACQQHFETHIPVWLIWKPDCVPEDMKVLKEVEVTRLDDIITEPEDFEVGQVLKWTGVWCYPSPVVRLEQFACPWPETSVQGSSGTVASTLTCMAGAVSNAASSSGANLTMGAIRVDRPGQCTQLYPPARSRPRAKPSATPNAELWEDVNDPAIPPTMAAWHSALQNVNKDLKRVCPNVPKIAYFFPHPSLFVRGESSDHRQRYLRNWLVSHAATNLFGLELIKVQHEVPSHVQFRDISISLEDLASIDQLTKSKVLWDLFEHNFQLELVTLGHVLMSSMPLDQESEWLNRACQVFPGDLELTMCAKPFLSEDQGLGSSDPQSKHEYVEKLWDLLAPWLGFPSDLMAPLLPLVSLAHVWVMEKKLVAPSSIIFFDHLCPALSPSCAKMSFHQPKWVTPRSVPATGQTIQNSDALCLGDPSALIDHQTVEAPCHVPGTASLYLPMERLLTLPWSSHVSCNIPLPPLTSKPAPALL
ncbi:hypothetical protein F5141DRAFT_1059280 [Pisolithus sp. B1]|nr:hypothetical protein F5141DRAFT_1059280 [Pisolithus sp. B1]